MRRLPIFSLSCPFRNSSGMLRQNGLVTGEGENQCGGQRTARPTLVKWSGDGGNEENQKRKMPSVNYSEILDALGDLTARARVEMASHAPDPRPPFAYPPIEKYLLDLKNGAKPESAAEDLFTALCRMCWVSSRHDRLAVAEGFVDFMLPEPTGQTVPLELKPLFKRDGPDCLVASGRQSRASCRPGQKISARPRISGFDRPAHRLVFQRPRFFL